MSLPRRRPRFRPHRRARFFIIQTAALWLCCAVISILMTGPTQGEVVVRRAMQHMGKPYVLGAAGPDRFDCSGLVMFCLGPEGFTFPLHSAEVIGTDENYPYIARPIDLLVGDVVTFDTVKDRDPSDHMGFYIGGNQFIHASSTGEVKISTLEDFYLEKFTGARRYVQVYYYLPTGAQIAEWFGGTGIPEKLTPVGAWVASLDIPRRLEPVTNWFAALDIPGRLAPIGDWVASLDIPGKLKPVKGIVESVWNSFFGARSTR